MIKSVLPKKMIKMLNPEYVREYNKYFLSLLESDFLTNDGKKKLKEILETVSKKYKLDGKFKSSWKKVKKLQNLPVHKEPFETLDDEDLIEDEFVSKSTGDIKDSLEDMISRAGDHYKKRIDEYGFTQPDMDVYNIIAEHLRNNSDRCVLFGGQALDLHLRTVGANIYEEGSIPDFDIVCDNPIDIAKGVAQDIMKIKRDKQLKRMEKDVEMVINTREVKKINSFPSDESKYWWIEIKQSMNKGVFKLAVNGHPVLDLKAIKPNILSLLVKHSKVIDGITDAFSYCNGIRVLNINNLIANFYFELSEVRQPERWEKIINRKRLVLEKFPISVCQKPTRMENAPKEIKDAIKNLKSFFAENGFSFSGMTSLNFYKSWAKSERVISDIKTPHLDVVFTSIKGRFLDMDSIKKAVNTLIRSVIQKDTYTEDVIIPTMEGRIYETIQKSIFYCDVNGKKYGLCTITYMMTCLPYIVRKIDGLTMKILSPLSLKIIYLYNIAYNPTDAARNKCMLAALDKLTREYYKKNKDVSSLDVKVGNKKNMFSEAFWGCDDDDYYVFADTLVYKVSNMIADRIDFDRKKRILTPSNKYRRKVVLDNLDKFGKKIGKYVGSEHYNKSQKGGPFYRDYRTKISDRPVITLTPPNIDINNCKNTKKSECEYPCTVMANKCVPIPKKSWMVFPTHGYKTGKWMGSSKEE